MSDTTRRSEATARALASPDPASSEQPISGKKRWAWWMWNVGRVLAVVAALGYNFAIWMPWVVVHGEAAIGDQEYHYTLPLGPGDTYPSGQAELGALAMLWLLVCIIQWQRIWPVLTLLGAHAYPSWLLIFLVALPEMPIAYRSDGNYVQLASGVGPPYIIGNPIEWLPGYYLWICAGGGAILAGSLLGISRIALDDELLGAWRRKNRMRMDAAVDSIIGHRVPTLTLPTATAGGFLLH